MAHTASRRTLEEIQTNAHIRINNMDIKEFKKQVNNFIARTKNELAKSEIERSDAYYMFLTIMGPMLIRFYECQDYFHSKIKNHGDIDRIYIRCDKASDIMLLSLIVNGPCAELLFKLMPDMDPEFKSFLMEQTTIGSMITSIYPLR